MRISTARTPAGSSAHPLTAMRAPVIISAAGASIDPSGPAASASFGVGGEAGVTPARSRSWPTRA